VKSPGSGRRAELFARAKLALTFSVSVAVLCGCRPQGEPLPNPAADKSDALSVAVVPTPGVFGEVPATLLEAIIEDLMGQENLRREDVEVERAESAVWPDGALGCPKPGEMYTHAQVPGYWVVLRVGGKRYDYRASVAGHYRLCGNPFKRQLPVG
jgi:hypothetical protein